MDVVLEWADEHVLDKAWASIGPEYPRDNMLRQCVSVSARGDSVTYTCFICFYTDASILALLHSRTSQLYTLTIIGIFVLYFGMAGGSYYLMCASQAVCSSRSDYQLTLLLSLSIHISFSKFSLLQLATAKTLPFPI